VPVRKTETFTTADANQTGVEVHVLQGERSMARENKSLGKFKLDGIPPMPAGMPQIEITYDIDANGVLNVTSREKSTGKEASITIQNTTTLSEDEVDRMVADAESHADEDAKFRELAEARNQCDSMRAQAAKILDETEGATDEQKQPVQEAIDEAQKAVDDPNVDKARFDELTQKIAEALQTFQQATAAQGQSATGDDGEAASEDGAADDDVIDADFKPAS
jgi:molecular chaperone DnaK